MKTKRSRKRLTPEIRKQFVELDTETMQRLRGGIDAPSSPPQTGCGNCCPPRPVSPISQDMLGTLRAGVPPTS